MLEPTDVNARELLLALFRAGVEAVKPSKCLPAFIPAPAGGRTVLVAAGKAAASMAQTVEQHFPGPLSGIAVVPNGHELPCKSIDVLTAAHPVPDMRSVTASHRALELAHGLNGGDQLVCLLSGGGSACLCLPANGISLDHKQALITALLDQGAPISDINCVRKHLSGIKGGRLALAARPAACLTLAISDVVGDDPSTIASGPTQPDPGTSAEALKILKRHELLDAGVSRWLQSEGSETPKPGDDWLCNGRYQLIAAARDALDAAQSVAEKEGLRVENLGDDLEGTARALANAHVRRIDEILQTRPPSQPRLLLSGGETTVRVTGNGKGGRNTEYLLALAAALDGRRGVSALACDTDGIDGRGGQAGAIYTPSLRDMWRSKNLDPARFAKDSDSAGFFASLDALVMTGPTLTNVNDFRAILLTPDAWRA